MVMAMHSRPRRSATVSWVALAVVVAAILCCIGDGVSQPQHSFTSCGGDDGACGGDDGWYMDEDEDERNDWPELEEGKIPELIMVAAATTRNNLGFQRLQRTCNHYGVNVTVVGEGEPYTNNYQKTLLFRKFVRDLHATLQATGTSIDDEPYVMLTDGYDVICNNGPEYIHQVMTAAYKDAKVVFSTEMNQFPHNATLKEFYKQHTEESTDPYSFTPYKYMNSGGIVGKPSHLVECLFPSTPLLPIDHDYGCDQAYAAQLFFLEETHKKCGWVLDFGQRIFGTTAGQWLGFTDSPPWILRHEAYLKECARKAPQWVDEDYLCSTHGRESAVNRSTSVKKWHATSHLAMGVARTRPFHVHGPGHIAKWMLEHATNFLDANDGWTMERQHNKTFELALDGVEATYMRRFAENNLIDVPDNGVLGHPNSGGICLSLVDVKHDPWVKESPNEPEGTEFDGNDRRSVAKMMKALTKQHLGGIGPISVVVVTHRTPFYNEVVSLLGGNNRKLYENREVNVVRVLDQKDALVHCVNKAKMTAYVKVDSVSVLENPHTIQWLLSRNVAMVAPHLSASGGRGSNFFLNDTRPYFGEGMNHKGRYASGEERIKKNDWRHLWAVRVVTHSYVLQGDALQRLANDEPPHVSFVGWTHKDKIIEYGTKQFDYEISRRVREDSKQSIYLDNVIDFGHLTGPGYEEGIVITSGHRKALLGGMGKTAPAIGPT